MTPRAERAELFHPPPWVAWVMALIPIFPPLYLLAFAAFGHLRRLPLTATRVVFFFVATQLLAALFTPDPLLSVLLATGRTALFLAMIAAGVYLQESLHLRPLLWGLLVIFLSAWAYTLGTQGWAGVQARLGHPYYYVVSLGLVAVVGVWLVVYWRGGAAWWRWLVGGVALLTFLAAGSRGPLLALSVGSLSAVAFARKLRRLWVLIPAGLVMVLAALTTSYELPVAPLQRLLNDQTSGREFVWRDSLRGWQTSPLGGVGAYQAGPYLPYLFKDGCELTPTLQRNHIACPAGLRRWTGSWLIAHNAALHWLLETGLIGLLGLLVIAGYGLWSAAQQGDPLSVAILYGFTAMNLVDVVIAVPSPHFSELWWTVLGMTLCSSGATIRPATPAAAPRPDQH